MPVPGFDFYRFSSLVFNLYISDFKNDVPFKCTVSGLGLYGRRQCILARPEKSGFIETDNRGGNVNT